MLRPTERGRAAYRQLQGLLPLYHVRLKHQGRTLAILSGDSEQEARERAERLADALFSSCAAVTIEKS